MLKSTFLPALALSASVFVISAMNPAFARTPALIVSNDPLPASLASQIYAKPTPSPVITPNQLMGSYYEQGNTMVSRKIGEIQRDLTGLQSNVGSISQKLLNLQKTGQTTSAEYYASVATISTQLQSGTTPGNPRLLQRLSTAQSSLDQLENNAQRLNDLSIEAANASSMASFMLENTRAAYGLTGAVEEDHVLLAQMEDSINNTVTVIDRLQNNISDDMSRTSAYLNTERNNLRTLTLAVSNGDLYGKNLANRPFSSVARESNILQQAAVATPAAPPAPNNPRPLAKIRFDRPNVNYQQALYMGMNEAMAKYPNARYEVVAVHPSVGNTAQMAIENTKARRNAEKVLRSMTEMGVSGDQIDISTAPSSDATSSEVQIYIR
ncbi:MAG: hypothetical protein DI586_06860 [Micavibrio aeruginosavorus]|uniref:OmpA-like domain-containing protein n=1 Tax=Micavibrio aeruginosavorus TaxID=349221 RepID=A0A2W5FHP5_9BACT|nr:MAG: hypothetical protein DI586_06860 [Micavibrio aeruginosavorus]